MKKWIILLFLALPCNRGHAQSDEAQQLLLNWEKLTQLKSILQNMYEGYKILHEGYTVIKDLSEGNFNLHKKFLDGLLEVSPAVRKYHRIGEIITWQVKTASEARAAFSRLRGNRQFTAAERDHLGQVCNRLYQQSVEGLEELLLILTAGSLRMTDDERLRAIDGIYQKSVALYSGVREWTNSATVLSIQREMEAGENETSRMVNGLAE